MSKSAAMLRVALGLLIVLDLTTRPAHAYIDPGAGSYALQIALAGLAAGLFSLRMFFGKIMGLFRRNTPSSPAASSEPTRGDE